MKQTRGGNSAPAAVLQRHVIYRQRRFAKRLTIGTLSLGLVFVLGPRLLHGQSSKDPLTIDANGGVQVGELRVGNVTVDGASRVGVGTPTPTATLDVSGKADTAGQVSLQVRSGNTAANFNSNQITFGYNNTDTYRHAIKTRHHGGQTAGNAIDFYVWKYDKNKVDPTAIGGLHTMTLDGGNVGIGATTPQGFQVVLPENSKPSAPNAGVTLAGGAEGNASLELRNKGTGAPYIDFAQSATADYDARIRLTAPGKLAIEGANVGIGEAAGNYSLNVSGTLIKLGLEKNGGGQLILANNPNDNKIFLEAFSASGADHASELLLTGRNANKMPTFTVRASNIVLDGNVFAQGQLAYYWGPDGRWKKLENRAGNWAGSYDANGPSDIRLKTELQPVPSALDKVSRLRGVTYRWNEQGLQYLTKDIETTISAGPQATAAENQKLWQTERDKRYKELSITNVGVVAQDVEAVLPEAVSTDESGYKAVKYHYLIALLIEALKEQDRTVKGQAQVIAQQQQEVSRLTAANVAVQQQVADLAALKAHVAQLDAVMRRVMATHMSDASRETSW